MISASAVAKRHELIMSLVAGLNLIMQGVEASGQLNNDKNTCRDGTYFFGSPPRFHSNLRTKSHFWSILRTNWHFPVICP